MDNFEFNKNHLSGVLSTLTGKPIEGPLKDPMTEIVYFRGQENKIQNIGFSREVLEDNTLEKLSSFLEKKDLKTLILNSPKDLLVTSAGIQPWN